MLEAVQQAEEEQRRMPVVQGDEKKEEKPTLPIVEWGEKGELRLLPEHLDDDGGRGREESRNERMGKEVNNI